MSADSPRSVERKRHTIVVAQRNTGEGPDEGDKLVQVRSSSVSDGCAQRADAESEGVLLPLDSVAELAGSGEQAILVQQNDQTKSSNE